MNIEVASLFNLFLASIKLKHEYESERYNMKTKKKNGVCDLAFVMLCLVKNRSQKDCCLANSIGSYTSLRSIPTCHVQQFWVSSDSESLQNRKGHLALNKHILMFLPASPDFLYIRFHTFKSVWACEVKRKHIRAHTLFKRRREVLLPFLKFFQMHRPSPMPLFLSRFLGSIPHNLAQEPTQTAEWRHNWAT